MYTAVLVPPHCRRDSDVRPNNLRDSSGAYLSVLISDFEDFLRSNLKHLFVKGILDGNSLSN